MSELQRKEIKRCAAREQHVDTRIVCTYHESTYSCASFCTYIYSSYHRLICRCPLSLRHRFCMHGMHGPIAYVPGTRMDGGAPGTWSYIVRVPPTVLRVWIGIHITRNFSRSASNLFFFSREKMTNEINSWKKKACTACTARRSIMQFRIYLAPSQQTELPPASGSPSSSARSRPSSPQGSRTPSLAPHLLLLLEQNRSPSPSPSQIDHPPCDGHPLEQKKSVPTTPPLPSRGLDQCLPEETRSPLREG